MSEEAPGALARLPTPAKILLIMTLALLPLGLASAWLATRGLGSANDIIEARARAQAQVAGDTLGHLLRHNRLAVRVAANAALADGGADPCARAQRILAVAPEVAREFSLYNEEGQQICSVGQMGSALPLQRLAPGSFASWISPDRDALYLRSAVVGGSAIGRVTVAEMLASIADKDVSVMAVTLISGANELIVMPRKGSAADTLDVTLPVAQRDVKARLLIGRPRVTALEQLLIFLPLLMWIAAAIISWWMVHRLLIRPLRRLQAVVSAYQPGEDHALAIPESLGPATEIHDLGDAFRRAVERIQQAEVEARSALEGQQRLVREVHHRVKNNLQVVASLLSIHGRTATEGEAKNAYSSIGRRVDALSVVHRNHYAEMEENRGIALRPLLTELSAGLRAAAPTDARAMPIELDLASPSTTQDVAVAVAFLLTEIIEFAMLRKPKDPVEISLRRTSELTATLSVSASVLVPETDADDISKLQFERIADGLARQLRSSLERKLGRYTVTLPIFPDK